MGPVSATTAIDAPRARVHQLIGELAIRPAITDHFIDEFRLERLESRGVGAAARFRIRKRGLWIEMVIAERWYRRQWARALARLREIAESDTEPPRLVVAGADRLVA